MRHNSAALDVFAKVIKVMVSKMSSFPDTLSATHQICLCSDKNHTCNSSKWAWICLACKMRSEGEGILSLGDTRQETSLNVGLLKKIVAGKKEFIRRSWENCYFQRRNSALHLLLRRRQHSNNTWNWFHVFSYERLFSFCYWRGILPPLAFLSTSMARSTITESTVLGLPDFTWLLRFLQLERNFLNYLFTVFWSTVPSFFAQ